MREAIKIRLLQNMLEEVTSEYDYFVGRLQRLLNFNRFLVGANQAIADAQNESDLLDDLCRLGVRYAHLRLIWIGRPDAQGGFQTLAAAGETGYLEGICISSNADLPEGQGPTGRCWREHKPIYNPDTVHSANMQPWAVRAARFGLTASATLPVYRNDALWAVLTVYHDKMQVFDQDLQHLLEEVAGDIGRGLDRLDLLQQKEILLEGTNAGIALARWPARRLIEINTALLTLLGYDEAQELIDRDLRVIFADEVTWQRVGELYPRLLEKGTANLMDVPCRRRDGTTIYIDLQGRRMSEDTDRQIVVWTFIDVTERHHLAKQLAHQAYHDALTGLPNRLALEQRLLEALARARRSQMQVAVGLIDLDDFKPINDNWGHAAGDELLKQLAERLQTQVRETDFLARLGGDEFVVVFEELGSGWLPEQLDTTLARLHQAVGTPFDLGHGYETRIDMSIGLAIYPLDAEEPGTLIRLADEAMYQAKQHKSDRHHWWRLGMTEAWQVEAQPEAAMDPYGLIAHELLTRHQRLFACIAERFIEDFYCRLDENPTAMGVISALGTEELAHLKVGQADYLRFLTHPDTSIDALRTRARHIGEVHALVGVDSTLLVAAHDLYQHLLFECLNRTALRPRERYRLLLVTEARLKDDLNTELNIAEVIHSRILGVLAEPLPEPGTRWADTVKVELDRLGALPGIQAIVLLRPDRTGEIFVIEAAVGPGSEAVTPVLQAPGQQIMTDPNHPRGQAIIAQGWRSHEILSTPNLLNDPRFQPWAEQARQRNIRSALALPIRDEHGRGVAMFALYGAWPHQFESSFIQQWVRSLQQRWELLWHQSHRPALVLSKIDTEHWRERLFSGGLALYLQPIIDLNSGRTTKAEALARLVLEDGKIISPGQFLPLLGDAELYQLFRMMLDQTLDLLRSWQDMDSDLAISVNLSPRTLLEAHLTNHIRQRIELYEIAPRRLILELLETEALDQTEQGVAIGRLKALGVGLALDDLGSGHSSLLRLIRQPLDILKIDQNLVRQLPEDPLSVLTLLSTLIRLGRDLERDIIIEGLETPALVEVMQQLGASQGQGYAFTHPMPAADLPRWLKGFHLQEKRNRFQTFAGALAYHWMRRHVPIDYSALPSLDNCLLTGFLHEQGLEDSEPARWCAHIQVNEDLEVHYNLLLQWLVARVREEAER